MNNLLEPVERLAAVERSGGGAQLAVPRDQPAGQGAQQAAIGKLRQVRSLTENQRTRDSQEERSNSSGNLPGLHHLLDAGQVGAGGHTGEETGKAPPQQTLESGPG